MAAFSSSKVYSLIDSLFSQPQQPRFHYAWPSDSGRRTPVDGLKSATAVSAIDIDAHWLRRTELRSVREAGEFLERIGFPREHGLVGALFVDTRCGYIAGEVIGFAASTDKGTAVRSILTQASHHQAHGIILAANDVHDGFSHGRKWQEFTANLHRKGEAIDIVLLDHIVRTSQGWKSRLRSKAVGGSTC